VEKEIKYSITLGPHLMDVLSKLYTDIPWAIVREYVTNARDGHVALRKQGKEPPKPIEIHVPNQLEPWFEVRDYGIGMSAHVVETVYTSYGMSLKNDNNDEIGGLGLGAKCGFAYEEGAGHWTITSFHDGEKIIYAAARDSRNMPTLTHMGTVPTQEPNGIAIKIPVSVSDVKAFRDATARLLRRFDEAVTITGDREGLQKGVYAPLQYTKRDDNFGWRPPKSGEKGVFVVMGSVPYPVDIYNDALGFTGVDRQLLDKQGSVDVFFDIGELDIVPSREGLSYTPHTVTKLKTRFSTIVEDAFTNAQDNLNKIDKIWDLFNFVEEDPDLYAIVRNKSSLFGNGKCLMWKGKALTDVIGTSYVDFEVDEILKKAGADLTRAYIVRFSRDWRSVRRDDSLFSTKHSRCPQDAKGAPIAETIGILPKNRQLLKPPTFLINDVKTGGIAACKKMLKRDAQRSTSYFLVTGDKNLDKDKLSAALDGHPVGYLSEHAESFIQQNNVVSAYAPAALKSYKSDGEYFTETEIDLNKPHIYVQLYRDTVHRDPFVDKILGGHKWFERLYKGMVAAGILKEDEVLVGIPTSRMSLIKKRSHFKPLHGKPLAKFIKYVQTTPLPTAATGDDPLEQRLKALSTYNFISEADQFKFKAMKHLVDPNSKLGQFMAKLQQLQKDLHNVKDVLHQADILKQSRRLLPDNETFNFPAPVPGKGTLAIDMGKLEAYDNWLAEKHYPLLYSPLTYRYYYWGDKKPYEKFPAQFAQYVRLMDQEGEFLKNEPKL